MADSKTRTYGLLATSFVAALVALAAPDVIASDRLALAASLGGAVVAFGAPLLMVDLGPGSGLGSDERTERIFRRAGFTVWYLLTATTFVLLASGDVLPWILSTDVALSTVMGVNVLGFAASVSWYERRM